MSYTHDRDITLEGWIVHTSQANAKGTIKEHRNPILESRCKSKRSGTLAEPSDNSMPHYRTKETDPFGSASFLFRIVYGI